MDEEKTLKDEYKKYFKELWKYIRLGLNGIVVSFPMLLFHNQIDKADREKLNQNHRLMRLNKWNNHNF